VVSKIILVNLYNATFYGKVGLGIGSSYYKSVDNSSFINYENELHYAFLGFGINRNIMNNLKWQIEMNINHSLNTVIKEFEKSKAQILSLGLGIEYDF